MKVIIEMFNASGDSLGYLKSFDALAHAPNKPYPTGEALFTDNRRDALSFPSLETAREFRNQQSTVAPRRPDGEDNRPLTAFETKYIITETEH